MGNASTSGAAGILIVDKPFVPDQDNNEELEVTLTVKGDAVRINSWPDDKGDFSPREPNNTVAVSPPLRGMVLASVWAINADDDEERREIGQVLVPHTSLEQLEESGFTIWLGLLDPSMVPSSAFPFQEEAERCFNDAVMAAKDPSKPKICFTFATIANDLLNGRNPQEDVQQFQTQLTRKPVMRLLGHANDLIKGLAKNNKALQKELRALHREFRSKETIFHSFVHVEKKTLEENKQRILATLRREADKWAKMMNGDLQVEVVFNQWNVIAKNAGLGKMQERLNGMNKKTMELLNRTLGQNDKEQDEALVRAVFHEWHINAKNMRTIEVAVMRMFGFNQPGILLEFAFVGWRHVMALEEREFPAKVLVECTLRNIDHQAMTDDMDLAGNVVHELKEILLSEIDPKHGVHAKHIRISLHPDRMPGFMTVQMMINPANSMTAGEIKKQLEAKTVEQELGAMIQARLVAVPGVFHMCKAGPLIIENVVVKYVRGETEQGHRDRMATHLDKMIEFFIVSERWMLGEIITLAWWSAVQHDKQKGQLCDKMLYTAHKFLESEAEEFMSSVLNQWQAHKDIAKLHGWTSRTLKEEKEKFDEFINEQNTRQGKDIDRMQTAIEVEKELAHEHVESVVKKWMHGEVKGNMMHCFYNWKRYIEIQDELQVKHEAVKLIVMKWVEGDDKGVKILCFRHWVHFIMLERIHLINGQRFAEAQAEWQELLNEQNTRHGEEISRNLTKLEETKEQAHEVTQLMLKMWSMGDEKGVMSSCLTEWRRYITIMRELERRHEHAKACVMNFVEGEKRGHKHLCFLHWVHFREMEKKRELRTDFELDLEHLGEANQKKMEEAERRRKSAKAAVELAVRKWECGSMNAIKMETFGLWHKYTVERVTFKRGQEAVKVVLLKFLEGETRGLQQGVYMAWKEYLKEVKDARKYEGEFAKARQDWDQFMAEENSIHGKELERVQTVAEQRKEQAHEVTEMMLKKWMLGDTKGLQTSVMNEWKRYTYIQRDLERRHEAAKSAVMGWIEGAARANIQLCWSHWVAFLDVQRITRLNEEKNKDLDGYLKSIREDHGKELERIMTEKQIREEQAHEVTTMMLKKWYAGDMKGTLMACVYEWKRYVDIMRDLERRHEACKTAVLSFLHDRGNGIMKVCFAHWDHFRETEKFHRMHNVFKDEMEGFLKEQNALNGKELDRIMTEKERDKEKAHEVTRMMLSKWCQGETKGLLTSVVFEWKRILDLMKELKRRNEAVKASMLGWIEGKDVAAKHLCFTHWVAFRDQERIHLQHGALRAELDELKNVHIEMKDAVASSKAKGKVAVEICLHKFLEGDRQGDLHSCFLLWEGYYNVMKRQRLKDDEIATAHSNAAYHIEKQKLDHELKVAKEKEAKIAAFEAMGFKSAKLQFMHYFELWTIFHCQTKEMRIEKEHKEHLLDKAALTMGWADNDQLKHIILTEWHHMLPNKDLIKAEQAREEWEKLHQQDQYHMEKQRLDNELKVAREKEAKVAALGALGFKSAKLQFMHFFELWTIFHCQTKEMRIEKEHKEHLLDKTMLTMGWADNDQLKHIVLTEWHHLLPNKDLIKAERAAEQWKKLHTGPMRQMLFKMCAYDDAHVLKDVFYVWKEFVDQLRFHHALKTLNASKKDQNRLQMERALMTMDTSLLSSASFAEWKRAWLHYCHSKDAQKESAAMKKKHGALVNKALAKWADNIPQLYLHAVLRALWETVAEGREARGVRKTVEVRKEWRRAALDYSCRYVVSLEKKVELVFFLHWRGVLIGEKSGRRADESNTELRKHLAVHCIATSQEADESLFTSGKYASLAGLLQGEIHTQGITLEALEHEVFLLESQIIGSSLHRRVLTA